MKKRHVFLPSGNPESFNQQTLDYPGQLGLQFDRGDGKRYRIVKLDSGATSTTPSGAVADNQLAYWKNRSKSLVTNDSRFALSLNSIAGVFRESATAGYHTCVQTGGIGDLIDDDGATVVGEVMVPSATSTKVTGIAVGTAPTYLPVGVARAADVANVVSCDILIPDDEDYTA